MVEPKAVMIVDDLDYELAQPLVLQLVDYKMVVQ